MPSTSADQAKVWLTLVTHVPEPDLRRITYIGLNWHLRKAWIRIGRLGLDQRGLIEHAVGLSMSTRASQQAGQSSIDRRRETPGEVSGKRETGDLKYNKNSNDQG